MVVPITVEDSNGKGTGLAITEHGEALIRRFANSDPIFKDMDLVDTAYNFFRAKGGQQFIITDVIAVADRDVGVNGATVIIYEATDALTITVDKVLLQLELAKSTTPPFTLTGVAFEVNVGKYVSAKTDDDDVFMTIAGYYQPKSSAT